MIDVYTKKELIETWGQVLSPFEIVVKLRAKRVRSCKGTKVRGRSDDGQVVM